MQNIQSLLIISILIIFILINKVKCQIHCESIESNLESSFILNCSLSSSTSTTNGLSVVIDKFGYDKWWKTPWEVIELNYDIYQILILKSCMLNEIGEYSFKDLNNLIRIDLSYNKLIYINENSFRLLHNNLIELDISGNLFDKIPQNIFKVKQMKTLEVFKFNDNKLPSVKESMFVNMKHVKHLELSNCYIKHIDTNAFGHLKQLEYLSLANNHLHALNEFTFRELSNLRYLYINDNLFICDCKLRWLLGYLKTLEMYTTSIDELNLIKCDQPNSLRTNKHKFLDINPDSFMCDVIINNLNIENQKYEINDDIVLKCDVYADPEPSIYWSFGNRRIEKSINDNEKYYIYEKYVSRTNKTSELKINSLQVTDLGVYTCTGEITGSINKQQIQFTIKNADTFLSKTLNKNMSNWTLLLLIAIAISICIFTLSIILFVCWKCKKLNKKYKNTDNTDATDMNLNKNLLLESNNAHNNIYTIRDDVTPKYALVNLTVPSSQPHTTTNTSDSYYYDDILQMSCVDGASSDVNLIPKYTHLNQNDQHTYTYSSPYMQLSNNNNPNHNTTYSTIKPKYAKLADNSTHYNYEHLDSFKNIYSMPVHYEANVMKTFLNNQHDGGSATSLDEEDLNDLKDFEDVTFDNLNKPPSAKNQK